LLTVCVVWAGKAMAQPVVVDAKLNERLWRDTPASKLTPSEDGTKADLGGEVRAIVAGRYLYVSARLPEPTGRVSARLTGRNPSWEDEDRIRILAGADIGYTDRIVTINPLGAYSIEKAVPVTYRNEPTMPYADEWSRDIVYQNADKFLVAASVGEKEWTVEAAIPLNELSAPASGPILVWAERIRAARPGTPRERWHWPRYGPAAKVPVDRSVKWDTATPQFRPPAIGNQEPPLEVGRTKTLPAIESGWNDTVWSKVPVLKLLRDEPIPQLPRTPTEVKLLHDGQTLAVLARCTEPGEISAIVKENDGAMNQDDSFHVYLATSGSAYVQVVVNALGYLLDSTGMAGGQRLSRAREWDSGGRVAVRREPGAWSLRVDVPLQRAAEVLGETTAPTNWRVLLLRYRPGRDGEPRETSVMPVVRSETPLCPARYRRLALVDMDPSQLPRYPDPPMPIDARVLSAEQRKTMNVAGMLDRHLRGRVHNILEMEKRQRDQIQTRADWERFRDPRLQALAASLGAFPPRVPLQTQVTKEYAGQGYRRQDLVYQSRPGLWVTANLYLPASPRSGMPGIVIIHSHHRPRTQAELQDMGILWARAGCAVLIMDQIGHGERLQNYPWNREAYHSRYVMGMQFYVAGESLIQWMVWDVMRGIDLLLERKDVQRDKIILLGAVAAGGDPAAVAAALDPRIAAVAPFNFGEATPRAGRAGAVARDPLLEDLASPGSGSWETTRNLRRSIVDQFFPWMICASVAPRRLIYSYEMGWEVERQPAWARYQKVFGLYDGGADNLDEAHGFGAFPGPGECANIGPSQRQTLYPELKRWFGIPVPAAEPDDRRPEAELAALNPVVAAKLQMRTIHELLRETAEKKLNAAHAELARLAPEARTEWLRKKWASKLGDIEPNGRPVATVHWKKPWPKAEAEGITLSVEPGITVPMLLLRPVAKVSGRAPLVVVVSEGGKERTLAQHASEIDALLKGGFVICLPDVRGTGETAPDTRRGPSSAEVSLSATELMLGNTLLGARLKDLRTVLAYLSGRQDIKTERIAIWGDSFAPANPARLLPDELPAWQIGPETQHQGEPLGGLLAILAGLYENNVQTIAVRGGLASYFSLLDDPFTYVPGDIVVPGILDAGDIGDVVAALATRSMLFENLIDGRNRLVKGQGSPVNIGRWIVARLEASR
jgi:cephalosporin-C deacetylase-like acetyl esterase